MSDIERARDPGPDFRRPAAALLLLAAAAAGCGGERRELEQRMRRVEPGSDSTGPDVPEVKPCYRDLLAGRHGRVWLLRHTRAERVDVEGEGGGREVSEEPEVTWREPLVFDVFAPDGRYLGPVRPDLRLERFPRPVIRGDTVWAVTRDELDVPYVVRLRLVPPGGGGAVG